MWSGLFPDSWQAFRKNSRSLHVFIWQAAEANVHAAKAPSQMVALINADGETVGESEMPCSPPLRFKISGSDRLHEECMQQGRGVGRVGWLHVLTPGQWAGQRMGRGGRIEIYWLDGTEMCDCERSPSSTAKWIRMLHTHKFNSENLCQRRQLWW